MNSYGEDLPRPARGEPRRSGRAGRPGLADVVRALQELEGLARIRLITLHPAYMDDALARVHVMQLLILQLLYRYLDHLDQCHNMLDYHQKSLQCRD